MTRTASALVILSLALTPVARAAEGEDETPYYRIEPVEIPKAAFLEVGGLALSPDGTLYVSTRRGEIWAVTKDPKAGKGKRAWRVWASGLHEPLGLYAMGNGDLVVAQRPELSRVRDIDHDGKADRFDTLTAAFGVTGNYHEYHYGPVRDREGNLYGTLNLGWTDHGQSLAPYRGWAYKLTPAGEFIPYASGFRSPSGIGVGPDGEIFVTDNQGDWVATSALYHLKKGGFYGHPESLKWEPGYAGPPEPCDTPIAQLAARRTVPAAWFIYGPMGHAPSEPVWDVSAGKFGPFGGQMLVGDQTKSIVSRVALEKIGGEYQGAVFPFHRGFASGITRMVFDGDGALWVGGTDRGWGATGGKAYALERLVWTGKVPFEVHGMSITKDGFDLTFTLPVDAGPAADPGAYSFQHYHFKYWKTYGSPHLEVTPVNVRTARVSPDGKRVSLVLPPLVKGRVYELHMRGLRAADGTPLLHTAAYYTVNHLAEAR